MTTLEKYKEQEKYFLYEFEKIKDYGIDVKVTVHQDATGQSYIVMNLYNKRKDRFITCVENLVELETIRIVLEELDRV